MFNVVIYDFVVVWVIVVQGTVVFLSTWLATPQFYARFSCSQLLDAYNLIQSNITNVFMFVALVRANECQYQLNRMDIDGLRQHWGSKSMHLISRRIHLSHTVSHQRKYVQETKNIRKTIANCKSNQSLGIATRSTMCWSTRLLCCNVAVGRHECATKCQCRTVDTWSNTKAESAPFQSVYSPIVECILIVPPLVEIERVQASIYVLAVKLNSYTCSDRL